jgi:hypothetical protein
MFHEDGMRHLPKVLPSTPVVVVLVVLTVTFLAANVLTAPEPIRSVDVYVVDDGDSLSRGVARRETLTVRLAGAAERDTVSIHMLNRRLAELENDAHRAQMAEDTIATFARPKPTDTRLPASDERSRRPIIGRRPRRSPPSPDRSELFDFGSSRLLHSFWQSR